jgi:LSD1 subclass zinc finger protein
MVGMASRITHVNCPSCGGTLGAPSGSRIVRCRYCGQASLVEAEGYLPQYFITPAVNQQGARSATGRILTEPQAPDNLIREARFLSANLYFVPFYEISGRRVGTFTMRKGYDSRQSGKDKYDTRVIMNDLTRTVPAARIPEWGMEDVDLESMRSGPQGQLHAFERKRIESFGRVFDPKVSEEAVLKETMMMAGTRDIRDETHLAELSSKLIYYPLWRARYTYKGRGYGVTLDGVTGKVLSGRVPLTEKGRIIWMLMTSALAGIFCAKLLRVLFLIAGEGKTLSQMIEPLVVMGFYLFPVIVIFLGVMLAVIAYGWDRFRYSSELEIRGSKRTVIRVNRPPSTGLDRMRDWLLRAGGAMLKNISRMQRRRW